MKKNNHAEPGPAIDIERLQQLLGTQQTSNGYGTPPPGQEARRAPRRRVQNTVVVDLSPTETGWLLDLSASGAGVQGAKRFAPGLRLSARFQLPGTSIMIAPSYEVVWTKAGAAGLKFLNISEQDKRNLTEWLDAHAPTPPIGTGGAPGREQPGIAPTEIAVELATLASALMGTNIEQALNIITEKASSLTKSDGAAVLLNEDGQLVYRARTGIAPARGVQPEAASGLFQNCIQQAKGVSCADMAADAPVDPGTGIRSILMVPIGAQQGVVGALAVFSRQPSAFTPRHQITLERLAFVAASLLASESAGHNHGLDTVPQLARVQPELQDLLQASAMDSVPAVPRVADDDYLSILQDFSPEPPASPESASEAACEFHPSLGVLASPTPATPKVAAGQDAPNPVTLRTRARDDIAAITESVETDWGGDHDPIPAFTGFNSADPEDRERNAPRSLLLYVLLVAVAVAGIASVYFSSRHDDAFPVVSAPSHPTTDAGAQTEVSAEPSPSPVPDSQPPPAPASVVVDDNTPQTTPERVDRPAPASSKPVIASSRPIASLPAVLPRKDPGADEVTPPAIALNSTPNPLNKVPSLGLPTTPAAPNVAPAANMSAPRLRVAAEIMQQHVINRADPLYPDFARRAKIEGTVTLGAVVGPDGAVKAIRVLGGDPALAASAVDALRQWRYRPYVQDGKPVEVQTEVKFEFRLSEHPQ